MAPKLKDSGDVPPRKAAGGLPGLEDLTEAGSFLD